MQSKKGVSLKASAIKEGWAQGPIGDLSLSPGHGRPVTLLSKQF